MALTLEEVVINHIQPLGIPAWYGAMIGHVEPILTLPIGLRGGNRGQCWDYQNACGSVNSS